jgi:hypothetical protein
MTCGIDLRVVFSSTLFVTLVRLSFQMPTSDSSLGSNERYHVGGGVGSVVISNSGRVDPGLLDTIIQLGSTLE